MTALGSMLARAWVLGLLLGFGPGSVRAQAEDAFPAKPIHITIGYPPGGGADTVARILQVSLTNALGRSVLIENLPGASGRAAATHVAHSQPDGYTLLVSPEGPIVIGPHISQSVSYAPLKDFQPVSLLTKTATMLVATPSLPVSSVKDLIALAKEKPGTIFFGSSGVGGPNHLAGEVFKKLAGVNLVHVPYPGTGAVIPAVAAGEVHLMFGFVPGLDPQVKAKAVKPLAVGSSVRIKSLPDVPTMAEAGVAGYDMSSWIGIFAPAHTPPEIVAKLQAAVAKAMAEPEVNGRLTSLGFEPTASDAATFATFLKDEDDKYIPLLKSLDIKE